MSSGGMLVKSEGDRISGSEGNGDHSWLLDVDWHWLRHGDCLNDEQREARHMHVPPTFAFQLRAATEIMMRLRPVGCKR